MSKVLDQWVEVMAKGDWMMVVLVLIAALLFYCLGYRTVLLRSRVVLEAQKRVDQVRRTEPAPWRSSADSVVQPFSVRLNAYRSLANALVALAPMAGLLGTVGGMMVMFNSIGDSTFSSQTGGITNGIAQALYTTETALVIAVPGLVWSRILNRREDAFRAQLDRMCRMVGLEPEAVR